MSRAGTIPTKDAVTYGREVVMREVERLRKGQHEFEAKGEDEKAARWRFAAYWMERTLGHGCVIGPFDERWLDDKFRSTMEEVFRG
jgi:hypothetical protein